MGAELTPKQQAFVDAFRGKAKGNGTQAARLAGYSGTDAALAVAASRLIRDPKVAAAIKAGTQQKKAAARRVAIADVNRCHEILTRIAEGKKTKDADRIQAVDKLLKSQGAYIEKREVSIAAKVVRVVMPDNGRGPTRPR